MFYGRHARLKVYSCDQIGPADIFGRHVVAIRLNRGVVIHEYQGRIYSYNPFNLLFVIVDLIAGSNTREDVSIFIHILHTYCYV